MHRTSTHRVVIATLALMIGAVAPMSVDASDEGLIAFARQLPAGGAEIFTINPDGSGEENVPVQDLVEDFGIPVWSPDGARLLVTNIVRFDGEELLPFRPATMDSDGANYHLVPAPDAPFDMYCHVWSEDAARLLCGMGGEDPGVFSVRSTDGGNLRRLTTNPFGSTDVPWSRSPDGSQFVFLRYRPGPMPDPQPFIAQQVGLFIANVDGTNVRQIVPYGIAQAHELASASWSPDGRQVMSSTKNGRLFVARTNGMGIRQLNLDIGTTKYFAFQPAWSPDGERIVFGMFAFNQPDLYTARTNGSDVVRLTNTADFENGPDWGVGP
jgi:Tol biopolymer transport system component